MTFKANSSAWTTKGTTLSHKSAEKEFGLTFDEIVAGIRAGKLQYPENSIYGASFLRLIRNEVEALVTLPRDSSRGLLGTALDHCICAFVPSGVSRPIQNINCRIHVPIY